MIIIFAVAATNMHVNISSTKLILVLVMFWRQIGQLYPWKHGFYLGIQESDESISSNIIGLSIKTKEMIVFCNSQDMESRKHYVVMAMTAQKFRKTLSQLKTFANKFLALPMSISILNQPHFGYTLPFAWFFDSQTKFYYLQLVSFARNMSVVVHL